MVLIFVNLILEIDFIFIISLNMYFVIFKLVLEIILNHVFIFRVVLQVRMYQR